MSEQTNETRFWRRPNGRKPPLLTLHGPILVVDDDPDDAKLTRIVIERMNPEAKVLALYSGRELISHLQEKSNTSSPDAPPAPTMILLDLRMPEMDGLAVLDWIKKQPQFESIPVVVLTGFNELSFLKTAYALGARSYLLKPITDVALRSVIASLSLAA